MRALDSGGWGLALLGIVVVGGCGGAACRDAETASEERRDDMALVEITNGQIVVGALPSLGGRVVVLKTVDGENLLHSHPKYWRPPFPDASLERPFAPWNGRIVWVGPQSGFWSQQDVRPDRRGAEWPPDPFNEAGRLEVLQHTATRLRLRGEVSPVTGLALEHDYEIVGPRMVHMSVTATNGRSTPVSWDLWPNTRVRPEGFPYVPLDPAEPPRIEGPEVDAAPHGRHPHEILDGWLAVPPGVRPAPPRRRLTVKAFARPRHGFIAFFYGKSLLVIRAEVVPVEKLHPEQAFVEIYRGAEESPEHEILELEMHGRYETLAPGASMSFDQTFEVLDYDGGETPPEHLARLSTLPP